jgi:5-methylcytosine-specific restriction endonuclease McrA
MSRHWISRHLRYRSAGGGDEWENLLSACWFCHIEGEHEGRLTVWPAASRPTWELGRRGRAPVLVVRGRQRVFG